MGRKFIGACTATASFLLVAGVCGGSAMGGPAKDKPGPNIMLILVDDVGYGDIAAFTARLNNTSTDKIFHETPRIDQFAAEGAMFTQFYASSVCTPTRASLLTGRMSNRMGMWDAYAATKTTFEKSGEQPPAGASILDHRPWEEYNYSKTDRGVTVPLAATALHQDETTMPQALNGYHTAFIGKWHLGSHNHAGYRPGDRGFNEVMAYFDGGGSGYHRPFRAYAAKTQRWDNPGPELTPQEDYLSDDIAQRVNLFLERQAAKESETPFFLYFAHPAAHTPIQSKADDKAHFVKKGKNASGLLGMKNPEYAGLLKGMDRSIGAVLDQLDELELADNTVVIFISDNGGHPKFTSSAPLRGGKSMLYEGGIRVPMIIRWPGRTSPGSVCDVPSEISDIYPTVMEIAGVNYDGFKADDTTDGETLVPLLDDLENANGAYPRSEFYQFYGKMGYTGYHNFATWATLRKGDYKLHYDYHGKVELYHIAGDVSEVNNLTGSRPQLAHDMLVQLTNWLAANCNAAYLPQPNPQFDPHGPLPYGPYVPLDVLLRQLGAGRK